jgi:hypothetical protein
LGFILIKIVKVLFASHAEKTRSTKIGTKLFSPVGCLLIHVQFHRMPALATNQHISPEDKMESALSQMKCKNKTVPDHAKKIRSR